MLEEKIVLVKYDFPDKLVIAHDSDDHFGPSNC